MASRKQKEDLIQAIKKDEVNDVKQLLINGCDPNCCVNMKMLTPALILAVKAGAFSCFKLLLQHGAAVDTRDKDGMTASMYASVKGSKDYLYYLVENKADVNKVNFEGANSLILAAKWDKFDCVQFLIEHDVDINKKDNNGKTALMYAAIHNSTECLNLLVDARADLNIADSVEGFTALLYALEHNNTDCANILLQNGADINIKGAGRYSEKTALTLAFQNSKQYGEFTMIETLLIHRADMTLSKLDQNYLHEMVARGKRKIVRLMVINGCPPFDKKCWEHLFKFSEYKVPISPLCVALLSGFYDIAKYFLINSFLTNYDVTILPNDPGIRQQLQKQGEISTEALAILNLICSSPLSLKRLSFVTISEIISKVTSTTRRQYNITNSGLPKHLQLELLFREWTSQICFVSWHELALVEDQQLESCNSCSECHGTGFRLKKR